jgi:hypothetical protein
MRHTVIAISAALAFATTPNAPARARVASIWIGATALMLSVARSPALAQTTGVHTPATGSVERKAILDAMRSGDNPDRSFVARYLRVSKGWAWITGDPQSVDGQQHYEAESALLRQEKERWVVVDRPCTEADCQERAEILRMLAKFPTAPSTIFPD